MSDRPENGIIYNAITNRRDDGWYLIYPVATRARVNESAIRASVERPYGHLHTVHFYSRCALSVMSPSLKIVPVLCGQNVPRISTESRLIVPIMRYMRYMRHAVTGMFMDKPEEARRGLFARLLRISK
jgi:hypothetical protein